MDLKSFRKKYKLTQQRFADMLGISRSGYKDIENGKIAPSPTFLNRLRKVQEQLEKEQIEEEKALKEIERIIG